MRPLLFRRPRQRGLSRFRGRDRAGKAGAMSGDGLPSQARSSLDVFASGDPEK